MSLLRFVFFAAILDRPFGCTNPSMVQGTVLANVAVMHELETDPHATIRTGNTVRMRSADGVVEVARKT